MQAPTKINYQGYTCFRGLVDDVQQDEHVANEYWGTKGRVGIVPLINNQHIGLLLYLLKKRILNIKHLKATFASLL